MSSSTVSAVLTAASSKSVPSTSASWAALALGMTVLLALGRARVLNQQVEKANSQQPRATNCDDTTGGCSKIKCKVCELANGDDELPADPFRGSVFVFQRDLSGHVQQFDALSRKGYLKYFTFFGCDLGQAEDIALKEATVMTRFRTPLPFEPFRENLYTIDELYHGFDPERPEETYSITNDALIYKDFVMSGTRLHDFNESLARRLHDACITEAMNNLFADGKHVCAIMGGHQLPRGSKQYRDAAKIARQLTQTGMLVCSGGGPGGESSCLTISISRTNDMAPAMEACNLGVWFANRTDGELEDAIDMLSRAAKYEDKAWLPTAYAVRRKYPLIQPKDQPEIISLGVPTFFYGHEPPNMFQTHVAKFFANSVREDALLSMAYNGILYFPGSAGTVQELFQDGCQNHYEVFGFASPMIFMDSKFWTETLPAYELLKKLSAGKNYDQLIFIHDEPEDAIQSLLSFHRMRKVLLTRLSSAPNKAGA